MNINRERIRYFSLNVNTLFEYPLTLYIFSLFIICNHAARLTLWQIFTLLVDYHVDSILRVRSK